MTTRRRLLGWLAMAAGAAFGQGRCRDGYGRPGCPLTEKAATAPIPRVFAPTGWKTAALDHITWEMDDPRKEAAFYAALMGWTPRSFEADRAVLDIGGWGSAVFRKARVEAARVVNFCFAIEPWNAAVVKAELEKRGLRPVAENDGKGFESFHVKDPNGFNLQIGNGSGMAKARKSPPGGWTMAVPFGATGWKTVWLDHISYNAANYKQAASFYTNLLGWGETYDEGSQHELTIGDVGDIIVRGGKAHVDHISFGIAPWDTDGVKAELEKRGLRARADTSTKDEIHQAAYKSYHTTTPNGFDLQISYVTRENRLALANAVRPKKGR